MESGLAALPVAVTQQNNSTTNAQKTKADLAADFCIFCETSARVLSVLAKVYMITL